MGGTTILISEGRLAPATLKWIFPLHEELVLKSLDLEYTDGTEQP